MYANVVGVHVCMCLVGYACRLYICGSQLAVLTCLRAFDRSPGLELYSASPLFAQSGWGVGGDCTLEDHGYTWKEARDWGSVQDKEPVPSGLAGSG